MDNRIRRIEARTGQLIPAQSEIWITVTPEHLTPTTEIRGRLMGPSCPYSNTVEVAYHLRTPRSGDFPPDQRGIRMQVIIPEASFWDTESPFLYRGPVELWQDGRCCDRVFLAHGLRSIRLDERGLRLNFRPITLRGRTVTACSQEELLVLHRAGYNLLVAPVEEDTLPLWESADRLGFLMLGRVIDDSEETLRHLERIYRHTSCLGWVAGGAPHPPLDLLPNSCLQGWACDSAPPAPILSWAADFLVGPVGLANLGKPLLVQGEAPTEPPAGAMILGTIV
jgi:hypothetical protein